ncbi:DUF6541 family protein [Microbacterium kunmingense]|uniref:DUF6541 family protein n=1 Tax=Microbacterium kunmingense TaxID=2915939 RepID=UPI0020068414|nr:DUF6541 family protein [Microbacterium kunmingense]
MGWFEFIPVLLATFVLLWLPGMAVGAALRLRGAWLVAASAPLTVSLVSVAAVIAPWLGLPWGLPPVLGLTALAVVAALAWSRWVTPCPVRLPSRSFATAIGAVLGGATIAFVLFRSIGDPGWISQRYDNFFHLNAIEFVIDTGNASPLWLGNMTSPEGLPFYPSGWHALASLIVQLTGASAASATNALIFVIAALVWPLGVMLLTRTMLGSRPMLVVGSGVLAASLPAFPYLPLHYGVLYPLFLGLACVPVILASAFRLLRPGPQFGPRMFWVLMLVLLVPGTAIAHPGALLAFLALSVPFVVGFAIHGFVTGRSRRWLWLVALGGYVGFGILVLWIVRPPLSQIYWPRIERFPQAIGEVVSAAVYEYPAATVVALLILVGAYSAVRRPTYARWMILGMAGIGATLYAIVAGSDIETLRMWLTGPWYNNAPRLASVWAVGVVPLAVLGLNTVSRFVGRRIGAVALRRRTSRLSKVTLAVVGGVLLVLTQGEAIRQAAADIEFTYELRAGGPILTPDEYALMHRISALVPEGEVIAANPWTGASFAYGISGRRVLMPHLLMDETDAAHVINTEFDSQGDSPQVCDALAETDVRFILDFGPEEFMPNEGDYSGLDELANSPFVELVAEEGEARLYRVVSCGLDEVNK